MIDRREREALERQHDDLEYIHPPERRTRIRVRKRSYIPRQIYITFIHLLSVRRAVAL